MACYEDPVCACADHAMDICAAAAGTDPARNAACWSAFADEGTVETVRVGCERTWCQVACGIR
jgi:hypothetical protein